MFWCVFISFLELTYDKMPKCQFLFSAVFGFRNPTQKIFSEMDGTKTRCLIFVVATQRTEAETKRSIRATTPPQARPGPGPRLGQVGPPWPPPYVASSPI